MRWENDKKKTEDFSFLVHQVDLYWIAVVITQDLLGSEEKRNNGVDSVLTRMTEERIRIDINNNEGLLMFSVFYQFSTK